MGPATLELVGYWAQPRIREKGRERDIKREIERCIMVYIERERDCVYCVEYICIYMCALFCRCV